MQVKDEEIYTYLWNSDTLEFLTSPMKVTISPLSRKVNIAAIHEYEKY